MKLYMKALTRNIRLYIIPISIALSPIFLVSGALYEASYEASFESVFTD